MTAYDSSYPPSAMNHPMRSKVHAGQHFPPDPNIETGDAADAAELVGLGYLPAFSAAWSTGAAFYFDTTPVPFGFHWDGAAWQPGAAPAAEDGGGAEAAPAIAAAGTGWPTTDELDAMTKAALVDVATAHGIDVPTDALKADVRALIDAAIAADAEPPPEGV